MLTSSFLFALAFTPDAAAANVPKIKNIRIRETSSNAYSIVVIVKHDDNDEVASVSAELESGDTVLTTLDDTVLPLSGALSGLPRVDATAALDLLDATGATLTSLTGTFGADGAIAFAAPRDGSGGTCEARICTDTETTRVLDIAVQAAWLVDGEAGYTLSLVLDGADALDVVRGALTASDGGRASLVAGEGEEVWVGALPEGVDPDGTASIEAVGADGQKLDTTKVDLSAAWGNDAGGTPTLAVDPTTTLALAALDLGDNETRYGLALLSTGWDASTFPVDALVEVDGGQTWEVRAQSYQRTARIPVAFDGDPTSSVYALEQDGIHLSTYNSIMRCDPYAAPGVQGASGLYQDTDGGWYVELTLYADDPTALPDSSTFTFTPQGRGGVSPTETSYEAVFEADIGVAFGVPVDFLADPLGLDFVFDVSLRGAAGSKSKQKTLASGSVEGQVGADEDGALVLGAVGKGSEAYPRGDILIGGEPIDFENTVGDTVFPVAPPVIQRMNGKGTRSSTTNTGQTQQAQLL